MPTGGGDHEAVVACDPISRGAQHVQCLDRLVDALANTRGQLDDVRVQLGLERARQVKRFGTPHQHVDSGCRLECLGIEDHHLFLDAE